MQRSIPSHQLLLLLVAMASLPGVVRANDEPTNVEVGSGVAVATVNQAASVDLNPTAGSLAPPDAMSIPTANPSNINQSTAVSGFGRLLHRRSGEAGSAEPIRSDGTPWYRSALGSLIIVLSIIGLIFMGLKRWLPAKRWTDGAKVMSIAARTMIDGKHGLALVKVGQRYVMVGVSPDRLTALAEISEASEVAELTAKTNSASGSRLTGFDRLLRVETETYEGLIDDSEIDHGKSVSKGHQSPRALRKLIGRLRTLQSSHTNQQ